MEKYSVEVGYRWASEFEREVREFEGAMREAMVHGGLSYEEAVWYVSTIAKEGE
jgi:hypothetical protein